MRAEESGSGRKGRKKQYNQDWETESLEVI